MKKMKVLSLVMVIILTVCLFGSPVSVQAAIPVQLSIGYAKTAPVIDGEVDASYGEMKWNQSATDFRIGDYNLYPRTKEECAAVKDIINMMNMKGWLAYDKEGIYMAVEAIDLSAEIMEDLADKHWNSTNIQVVMYIDASRYFFSLCYTGKNKVSLFNDNMRSELDVTNVTEYAVKETALENGVKLCWEIKIPYEALWDCTSISKHTDMRMGVIQTSMAQGYCCQAFGEAYNLKYDSLVPVNVISRTNGNSKPANPDFDVDGRLTITDLMIMINRFEDAYANDDPAYDIDGDGLVDESDMALVMLKLLEMDIY